MNRTWSLICLVLGLAFLTSCRPAENPTPTPFPTIGVVSSAATPPDLPISLTLAELAANPEDYEGLQLRLSGRYRRQPLLVCGSATDRFQSPATWGLVDGGLMAQAGGYDRQLRPLIPDGLNMIVEGRWQSWQGPVGCGKQAVARKIWYLAVSNIISPSPISQVTLTPSPTVADGQGTAVAQVPDGLTPTSTLVDIGDTGGPDAASPQPSATLVGTIPVPPSLTPTVTPAPAIPTATGTAASTQTFTPTLPPGATATASATPTPTLQPGTTATATSPPGPSTPTQSPVPYATIMAGDLEPEELYVDRMGQNELHSWTYEAFDTPTITVQVVASSNVDILITVRDGNGVVLANQNSAPPGGVEILSNLDLPADGAYEIEVKTLTGAAANYAIMLLDEESFAFVFNGLISYGSNRTASLADDSDHFWHFESTAGEIISFSVTPQGTEDLFLEFYGTTGDLIDDVGFDGFIDDGDAGEPESLENYDITESGIYTIRVGEFDFLPATYELTLSRQ